MSSSNWKPILSMDASTGGKLTTVNPAEIKVLPECQARVDGTDDTLVAEYAADMREYDERIKESESEYPTHGWQEFPNINCIHVPDMGHVLISGHHRLEAILQVGYEEILVYSVPGTRQDAIVWSKQQNADNGKRRTNADKAHVVKSCLLDDELKLWSDRTIAKWCGVTHGTVAKHEKSLVNFTSENGEPYTRPTRRKRLSKSGEIEWVETASIGNGNPEKPNRKNLKAKHHSAVVNVQSAFFTADLHEQLPFSELGDKKVGEFFKRTVTALRLRLNIFTSQYYHKTGGAPIFVEDCIEAYRGADLTNAEIKAEIEVLEDIASQIRWYGKTEDGHLGWIDNMLVVEPEQQETETPAPDPEGCRGILENTFSLQGKLNSGNIDYRALGEQYHLSREEITKIADEVRAKANATPESEWENEWLPRLKEVFIEKGYDSGTVHPSIYKAVAEDQGTRIYDMSDAQLTVLISQSKTVFNWKDNPENWITNRGESKIGWALSLLEDVAATQETGQPSAPSAPNKQQTEAERLAIELECARGNAENDRRRVWVAFGESDLSKSISKEDFALSAARQHDFYQEGDYGSGENYLLSKDYAPIDKLSLKEAQEIRAFFNSVETAIHESADWVLALVEAEVVNTTESDVISKARSQVSEMIEELDTPKPVDISEFDYSLDNVHIGFVDNNDVREVLSFHTIASPQLGDRRMSELPDSLKIELLKLIESIKR